MRVRNTFRAGAASISAHDRRLAWAYSEGSPLRLALVAPHGVPRRAGRSEQLSRCAREERSYVLYVVGLRRVAGRALLLLSPAGLCAISRRRRRVPRIGKRLCGRKNHIHHVPPSCAARAVRMGRSSHFPSVSAGCGGDLPVAAENPTSGSASAISSAHTRPGDVHPDDCGTGSKSRGASNRRESLKTPIIGGVSRPDAIARIIALWKARSCLRKLRTGTGRDRWPAVPPARARQSLVLRLVRSGIGSLDPSARGRRATSEGVVVGEWCGMCCAISAI